jgi:hypothetical protein
MKGWKTRKADARKTITAMHESAHAVAHIVLFGDLERVSIRPAAFVNSVEATLPDKDYQRIIACRSSEKLARMLNSGVFKWSTDGMRVTVLNGGCAHRRADEYCFPQDIENLAVCTWVGMACEELYTGNAIDELSDSPDSPALTDRNLFLFWVDRAGLSPDDASTLFVRARDAADAFVRAHLEDIVSVANALLDKGTLTGDEVKDILGTVAEPQGEPELVAQGCV